MGETTKRPIATPEQISHIIDQLGVKPSALQTVPLYDTIHRTLLVAGGERGGKSWVSALFGATRTPFGKRFWIVAATYELCRPEFDYWVDHLMKLGAIRSQRDISRPKIGKAIAVTKSGQIIETKSADDVVKLAAQAPDGIIMAEAAQLTYEGYLKCIGRLSETRGWLLMSGTFESSLDWYSEKFLDWQTGENLEQALSISIPTWSNEAIFPLGREDPEMKRLESVYSRVEGLFDERCGAIPTPPASLIFREFRYSIHVTPTAIFNPALPVYLAVDPSSGGDPYAVHACQFPPCSCPTPHPDTIDNCYVIDEYYENKVSTEEIVKELSTRPWWKRVEGGAIDVEAPDERKRWRKYGKINLVAKKIDQFAGIRRLKSFLYWKREEGSWIFTERPHLYVNPKCKGLQYELSHYKRKMSPEDSMRLMEKPPAGQRDHSVKAIWYLLIARYGDVRTNAKYGVVKTWNRKKI